MPPSKAALILRIMLLRGGYITIVYAYIHSKAKGIILVFIQASILSPKPLTANPKPLTPIALSPRPLNPL